MNTLDSINSPKHFIKFGATRFTNGSGTRDYGTFQIHSSTNLFPAFGRDYFGNEDTKVQLAKSNKERLVTICSLYHVGGQSLTCEDGIKQEDGSWLFNGQYDCWSD